MDATNLVFSLLVVLIIVGLATGGRKLARWDQKTFLRRMRKVNQEHGTSFGTTDQDYGTFIGTNATKGVLAFDRKNRKIALITKGGKQAEILDYGFIRTWRVIYDEKTSAGGVAVGMVAVGSGNTLRYNVAIEVGTTDINRPLIRIWMPNYAYAEQAKERMTILINH